MILYFQEKCTFMAKEIIAGNGIMEDRDMVKGHKDEVIM